MGIANLKNGIILEFWNSNVVFWQNFANGKKELAPWLERRSSKQSRIIGKSIRWRAV
jgi:hypothetical protein